MIYYSTLGLCDSEYYRLVQFLVESLENLQSKNKIPYLITFNYLADNGRYYASIYYKEIGCE